MSQGLGLHFTPGPGGRPHALILRDIAAECAECGAGDLRRYYHDTPFHSLTIRRLGQLADATPTVYGERCAQCEEQLGPSDVVRWTLSWGFPGGAGVVRAYGDGEQPAKVWTLHPFERLDPQLLPVWSPPNDASSARFSTLCEVDVRRLLGRVISPKEAIRQLVRQAVDRSSDAGDSHDATRLAPGLIVTIAERETADATGDALIAAIVDERARDDEGNNESATEDGVVLERVDLGTPLPGGFAGAPSEWLADLASWPGADGLTLLLAVDIEAINEALNEITGSLNVPIRMRKLRDGRLWMRVPGERDPDASPHIDPRDIAHEAARSAIAPADAARLEIDRALLGLTGYFDDVSNDERSAV